jgi:hypothetical protein
VVRAERVELRLRSAVAEIEGDDLSDDDDDLDDETNGVRHE